MDRALTIGNTGWRITLKEEEGDSVENFVLDRADGKYFHTTMVEDSVPLPDGQILHFFQPMLFEHDDATHEKVGDVVVQLRQHPDTLRYMVQVEVGKVFVTETETMPVVRTTRSSVDNIVQATRNRRNEDSGWTYTNDRRIGGKRVKTHYAFSNWSFQHSADMMDVYDYADTLDGPGQIAFFKALIAMDDEEVAFEILRQARSLDSSV